MKYYKNTEIAALFHVSEKAVRNWVEATQQGKLTLELFDRNGRPMIANTSKNMQLMEELVAERKKFKNTRSQKTVLPRPEFYRLFSKDQIYDLISNLEIHREIPRQYNYFNGGANHWDTYAQRLASEDTPNVVNSGLKLLEKNLAYLDSILSSYAKVNVIDIGPGNALPVKELLRHFIKTGKMGRYIAIDISPDMLKIAEANIEQWFGDKIVFEGYQKDINYDRFFSITADEYLKSSKDSVNLVLLLGGTLYNMRDPDGAFRVIHDSMGINDFLIHTQKLDTEATRRYFDFNSQPVLSTKGPVLAPIHGFMVEIMGIDESLYELELGYDDQKRERYERIRLKVSLKVKFELETGPYSVEMNKGSTVLIWRSKQQTALDVVHQFDRNDFYMMYSSQTTDREYILTVSNVKIDY